MIIGRVAGSVVSTRKHEQLKGFKLLIIEPMDESLMPKRDSRFVAVDNIGAGINELVLVTQGSSARLIDEGKPFDSAVVGIIDSRDKICLPND